MTKQLNQTMITPNSCVWVSTPDGGRCECEVLQTISSSFDIFPQVWVKALHGWPFNGAKKAIVSKARIFDSQRTVVSNLQFPVGA